MNDTQTKPRVKSPFGAWVVRPEVVMVVDGKVIHDLDSKCVKGTADPKDIHDRQWAVDARKAETEIVEAGGDRKHFFCTRCLIADPAGEVMAQREKAAEREEVVAMLVDAIRDHAEAPGNYEAGWDVVVEAYDDEQIAAMIGRARTKDGAIKKVAAVIATIKDHRDDIAGEVF
jgi:hypothetical protein